MRVIGFYKNKCFSRNIDEQVNFEVNFSTVTPFM